MIGWIGALAVNWISLLRVDWIAVLAVCGFFGTVGGFFAMVAWITWTVASNARERRNTETQRRLLEKFGTSQEVLEYLNSEAGQGFRKATKGSSALH
jgi:hypothetical protein